MVSQGSIKGYNFDDPSLLATLQSETEAADYVFQFLTMLAVNHAIIPEKEQAADGSSSMLYFHVCVVDIC